MTPEENRRRVNRLRAEEAGPQSGKGGLSERHFGPEKRRQAEINKQRMRMEAA